jgi:hypothetical protein
MALEDDFGKRLSQQLRPLVAKKYAIETKRSLLYTVSFDDEGLLQLGQNADREPTRGGGTGFEQDLLIFERSGKGQTAIVPRVSVELKFGRINTHDGIVYSEKARRIRSIYPYVRYGLILGGMATIPPRTLRLGTEFDFIAAIPAEPGTELLEWMAKLLRKELRLSCSLTAVLRGSSKIGFLHRDVRHGKPL